MKLLIHGYYGAGNAGDDALLQSMIDQISKRYPRCQITVSIRGKGSPAYRGPAKVEFDKKTISQKATLNCHLNRFKFLIYLQIFLPVIL